MSAVEGRTSAGCPILELPLVEFPEVPPVNGMADYSHLWSYLYSSDLRWSYGAVKGTSQGAWGMAVKDDAAVLLAEAKAAGFCGMQFDTSALANRAELVDELAAFGLPDLVSSSGRWLYFDLSGFGQGEYVVVPISGFSVASADSPDPSVLWWMVEEDASLTVRGAPSTSVDVVLDLVAPPCGPAIIEVAGSMFALMGLGPSSIGSSWMRRGQPSSRCPPSPRHAPRMSSSRPSSVSRVLPPRGPRDVRPTACPP